MANKVSIYSIRNKATGKTYVGQTRDIETRFKVHSANSSCAELRNDIAAIGIDGFEMKTLERCAVKDADAREEYWILKLNCIGASGYNRALPKKRGVPTKKRRPFVRLPMMRVTTAMALSMESDADRLKVDLHHWHVQAIQEKLARSAQEVSTGATPPKDA